MADADHTARVRPQVNRRATSPTLFYRPEPAASTLSDVNRATLAIVHVLAQCVAALGATKRGEPVRLNAWPLPPNTIQGLSTALKVLKERDEALRRSCREGRGA